MKILTKKNGIALVAVLTVLLVLTLLLPAMFTMSESATRSAMMGTDDLKSSYLARTMLEMSVAAFEDFYDMAEEKQKVSDSDITYEKLMSDFTDKHKLINAETLYMYINEDMEYPVAPARTDFLDEAAYNEAVKEYEEAFAEYEVEGVKYITSASAPQGNYRLTGTADCKITYSDDVKYYEIDEQGNSTLIDEDTYKEKQTEIDSAISSGTKIEDVKYVKVENRTVSFIATARVNGKTQIRRCVMILPTKPSEEQWIAPATLGSNQIFPDTSKASGITNINYDKSSMTINGAALKQPLYIFSCVGNMVISDENMTYDGQPYTDYDRTKISFGLHPETGTREPDNDPQFNCLRTYNMDSWASDAQLDNFVAFTSTNAIQVDLPVNLIVNPARTYRIGDGLSDNAPLYKVLVFQAPTIVFNKSVSSFVSLYTNSIIREQPAYRMTTIMLSAPKNTPYTYLNGDRDPKTGKIVEEGKGGKTVKAGRVFFKEDVYLWVVPYGEDGSNYKTQTVYYKGKDIYIYKIANAGDIYYFNSEVPTNVNGQDREAGFSMTGYFMDVYYPEIGGDIDTSEWWQIWTKAQNKLFNIGSDLTRDPTYTRDDFKWVGNIYSGAGEKAPQVDDFYVVWES